MARGEAYQRILSVWDGPILIALLGAIVGVSLLATPGTRTYGRAQNGVLIVAMVASVLFVIRARGAQGLRSALRSRQGMKSYARSGLLGLDVFFVAAALSIIFVLNVGVWQSTGVRIGTVAGLAMVCLITSAVLSRN
jgi:hypothetical protein